jgi:phosphoribosyl 1,2-cyclic phosphodiesterase
MPARFTVLASGSSGNASLLEADGYGLLIDCGLGPRALAGRLAEAGRSWAAVSAVLLTHTHGDHWNKFTLDHLRALRVPLFAHARHHGHLARCEAHDPLRKAGLAREFAADSFEPVPGITVRPVPVPHDSDPTFAFRIEGPAWALGFASDLGRATDGLLAALAGVDALAVEYNHDVAMQKASRRPAMLIDRVLGDRGHLSNAQAADLTRTVASGGGLRAVVQLHLSQECNRPALAAAAGRAAVTRVAPAAAVVTAGQFEASPAVTISDRLGRVSRAVSTQPLRRQTIQPSLPGC